MSDEPKAPKRVIKVSIESIYGREVIRPLCDTGEMFCRMLGQKTLTRSDIEVLKEIGFVFQVETEIVEL